ncbi:hypothetical protein N7467_005176 [Penicillium canescens]|nr:hypothetical protein N7467_005176 [Penicillium canescens]
MVGSNCLLYKVVLPLLIPNGQVHTALPLGAMDTLWLGTLSLRDQGISGNSWAWAGVRSCIGGASVRLDLA